MREDVTLDATVTGAKEGWMNAKEILASNKLPLDLPPEEEQNLLRDVLAECERVHEISCTVLAHDNPYLTKYWYTKPT